MQTQRYKVNNPDSELARLLDEADQQPVDVEKNGVHYCVMRVSERVNLTDDPWTNYDPESVRAALRASAGAFKDIDTHTLKKEIWEAHEPDTPGRPA